MGLSRSGQQSSSLCILVHRAPLRREENRKHKEVIGVVPMTVVTSQIPRAQHLRAGVVGQQAASTRLTTYCCIV